MKYVIGTILALTLCACDGHKGDQGSAGQTGVTGQNGANGSNGSNGTNGIDGINGTNGVDGKDGAQGAQGNQGSQGLQGPKGDPGAPGTIITWVQFCSGTTVYPSKFVEGGFCIAGNMYAVYSANNGFLTYLPPGAYSSNAIGSSCSFTLLPNCQLQ